MDIKASLIKSEFENNNRHLAPKTLKMKIKLNLLTLLITSITLSKIVHAQSTETINYNPNLVKDTTKKSINAAAFGKIGQANVNISYHSPGVRNRVIWGGLVPFDEVWVTGAHSATTVEIDKPFMLGDKTIAPGKYALFTIPGDKEWTIIFNTNWQQHLTDDYNIKDDVIRIKVKTVKQNTITERLQYFIKDIGNNKGTIAVAWEKLRVEFNVAIKG